MTLLDNLALNSYNLLISGINANLLLASNLMSDAIQSKAIIVYLLNQMEMDEFVMAQEDFSYALKCNLDMFLDANGNLVIKMKKGIDNA